MNNFSVLDTLLERQTFKSYEDFVENYKVNVPPAFNFGTDVVDAIAREDPDRRAMVWCDDHDEEIVFPMADIARLSDQAANWFQSQGIGKGDAVLLLLRRRWEYWPAVVGLHKIGATAIPGTTMLKKHDLVYRFKAGHVKMVLAINDEVLKQSLAEAAEETGMKKIAVCGLGDKTGWIDFNEGLEKAGADYVKPVIDPAKDTMLLFFSSGTTGMPKMVKHNFLYPLAHIVTAKFWHCCVEGGLHFTVAETGWGKASWGKIYGQWMANCAVMVYDMDRFHADKVLDVIEKYKVTTFCAPPTIYRYFIKEDLRKRDWSGISHCTIAGEPLNPEVYNQFLAATGHKLHEGFGQTETALSLATYPWMTPKPGSMGKPSPFYRIDLVDENDNPCETGEEGQIVIRTDGGAPLGVFSGYQDDPVKTKGVWHDDLYHTGDVAWRDEDGYFWFVGRADDVIKSSGYRIGPFEVESALMEHPAVLECAVTGAPDPQRGTVVKATIVLAKGYEASEELVKDIQNHVKRATAPYKYPRIVEFVEDLPKTISGKIRHSELRARHTTQEQR